MAAVKVSLTWFGTRKSLTAEQKAEAAEPFRGRSQVYLRRQKAARHAAPGLQGRERHPRQGALRSGSRCRSPYPEPGIRLIRQKTDRPVHRQYAGVPGRVEGGRGSPRRPVLRTERWPGGNSARCTTRPTTRISRRALRDRASIFRRWSRRSTCSTSTRRCTRSNASGCSRVSTRPCGWPKRRSPPNWAGCFRTSPSGSRATKR